jgi:hypothetical protein
MATSLKADLQVGPCVVCGRVNYPLSMGGPQICPACDCGIPLREQRLQEELGKALATNVTLATENERLRLLAVKWQEFAAFLRSHGFTPPSI